jgi:MFS-type transporter involved in bile tolerance (Atg22 family)
MRRPVFRSRDWTKSRRAVVLSVIVFFVLGALVLRRVDVEAGEAQARAAEIA